MKWNWEIAFFILADCVIWFGVYYLDACAIRRKAKQQGQAPDLHEPRYSFLITWLVMHGFMLKLLLEFAQWDGMD